MSHKLKYMRLDDDRGLYTLTVQCTGPDTGYEHGEMVAFQRHDPIDRVCFELRLLAEKLERKRNGEEREGHNK